MADPTEKTGAEEAEFGAKAPALAEEVKVTELSAARELEEDLPDLALLSGLGQRLEVDSSEKEPGFLLVAENGIHLKLSETVYCLLSGLVDGASVSEIAARLSKIRGHEISLEETRAACRKVARRIASVAERESKGLPRFFWLRFKLFPKAVVERVAGLLSVLYGRPSVAILLFFICTGLAVAYGWGPVFEFSQEAFPSAYILFLISLVAHEFGHASACARFGAAPSDIGCTMYLIYPAFYSDVSAAWQLRRWQRVVVDLGGVYFQFVVAAVYVLTFKLTGWEPLWMAFGMILYGTLFSLNPIFKFDGYWVLADSLGVVNLAHQPSRILRALGRRLFGLPAEELPWPPVVISILAVYSVLSMVVWSFFIYLLTPFLKASISEIPDQVAMLGRALFLEPGWPAWQDVRALVFSLMLWVFAGLMIWRLLGKFLTPLFGAVWRAVAALAARSVGRAGQEAGE